MSISPFLALTCPLDGQPLMKDDRRWHCQSGHSFDIAKQGHINLLPVQHKRSRDPGDSKEMIAARQRFLATGCYQTIAEAMAELLIETQTEIPLSCLDAGCGEGYYLHQLGRLKPDIDWSLVGLDISKWAVLAAAKQHKDITWLVGSNANLPIQNDSLDRIICAFGFPVFNEFARTLKPGGRLLLAEAGPEHMLELREIIYPSIKADRDKPATAPEGFTSLSSEQLNFRIRLDQAEHIADLLLMTPHLHRANAEGRAKAAALEQIELTVDVNLTLLESSR